MPFLRTLLAWLRRLRIPLLYTVAGLVLSFVFLGLPGFASYWPAEQLFIVAGDGALLNRIRGDALWPVLISASMLQALLITPAHLLVAWRWPALGRVAHVLLVALLVWVVCVAATSMMLLAAVGG